MEAQLQEKMSRRVEDFPTQPIDAPTIPGPKLLTALQILRGMRRDPLGFLCRQADAYGDVVRLRMGPRDAFLIRDPAHIAHVLQTNSGNYGRDTPVHTQLRLALGNGLLTSQGEFWRRQRRVAQPLFHRDRSASAQAQIVESTRALVARWQRTPSSEVLDVCDEMHALSLDIVGKALFGLDFAADSSELRDAVVCAQRYVITRMSELLPIPSWVPTPTNRRFQRAMRTVDRILYAELERRRARRTEADDYLAALMDARDEGGNVMMSDALIRDEFITMMSAGHETTANGLTWTLYLLSQHPAVAERVRAEACEVLDQTAPERADLGRLQYTTRVFKEAMRLYPPVAVVGRSARQDDCIGGYRIPAGSVVLVSAYVTHRHPEHWKDAEAFDPDRFEPASVAQRPRFAYLPFGGGPHQCIGSTFGTVEALLVLALILRDFNLELEPGHPVALDPLISLRPMHGMRMRLHPAPRARQTSSSCVAP